VAETADCRFLIVDRRYGGGTLVSALAVSPAGVILSSGAIMADYTQYEYMPICIDGCDAITGWLQSKKAAHDVAYSHELDKGHHCELRERMKSSST